MRWAKFRWAVAKGAMYCSIMAITSERSATGTESRDWASSCPAGGQLLLCQARALVVDLHPVPEAPGELLRERHAQLRDGERLARPLEEGGASHLGQVRPQDEVIHGRLDGARDGLPQPDVLLDAVVQDDPQHGLLHVRRDDAAQPEALRLLRQGRRDTGEGLVYPGIEPVNRAGAVHRREVPELPIGPQG